jgi:hypothetical protein
VNPATAAATTAAAPAASHHLLRRPALLGHIAERAGLSVRAIGDLERGRTRFPYQDTLARLADALDLRGPARTEFITTADRRLAPAGTAAADGHTGTDPAEGPCRGSCRWHCPPLSVGAAS